MKHIPVLLKESIDLLDVRENKIYVDATLGGGGHSKEILKKLNGTGHLYSFDLDPYAINKNKDLLKKYSNFTIINDNFKNIKEALSKYNVNKVDGILYDLGMSSFQIDDPKRGFSYMHNEKLDMRMDSKSSLTAEKILNTYDKNELIKIFKNYGEENNANKIAYEIIKNRPIKTTFDLVNITDKINYKNKGHSAKRVFQALRIAVNNELENIYHSLNDSYKLIKSGGVICVISFHSLEDKIVKKIFKSLTEVKIIKGLPVKVEPDSPFIKLTKKPLKPTLKEINNNPRSRSSILRAIKKK